MKNATRVAVLLLTVALTAFLISGCLITEVIQSLTVAPGGTFEAKITITDKTADVNAYKGALAILVPDDWEFISGTYNSQVGSGAFALDPTTPPTYGDIDAKLPPPAGMKWIKLLSDAAYANGADVVHEASVKLKAGTKTGDFQIGYLVTKNTVDMLNSINPSDTDNDNAWADTSMNHKVTVGAAGPVVLMMNEIYSQGTKDATAPDFIEIYNGSDFQVDLSGYLLYDNGGQAGSKPKKAIPAGTTIPAWGVLAFNTDYTTDTASDFGLSSGGETVWFANPAGAVIDSCVFPAMKVGQSYQRIPDGGAWKLWSPLSKGKTNAPVKMNEIYSRGTTADPDWIELYNSSADTIDISGYKIYDTGGQSGSKPKMVVAPATKMAPKSWFVIVTDDGSPAAFGLSSGGEKVWLEDSSGVVVDSVAFLAMQTTESYSRIPDAGVWQLSPVITRGATNGGGSGVAVDPKVVEGYSLSQNYPNPFNPSTTIEFTLPQAAEVQVAVYNLAGQRVAELANGRMAAGMHQLTFNANGLASGIYLYAIRSAGFSATKRMVLMK
ncbi:MAG TPA: lamin tail domain-containing protein [bacterium]|nr:lamin tail domain-containing protein [bacterium]HQG44067.1 lamin tail domain-containing protein [bacterium]HQI48739.1 lamin tail domain-containing protein [bacterium]HQJ65226.1 lamin tail domain-containing protein [bacterium]